MAPTKQPKDDVQKKLRKHLTLKEKLGPWKTYFQSSRFKKDTKILSGKIESYHLMYTRANEYSHLWPFIGVKWLFSRERCP